MAVNPETGTSSMDTAISRIEGILDASEPAEAGEVAENDESLEEAEETSEETEESASSEDEAESEEEAEPEAEEPEEQIDLSTLTVDGLAEMLGISPDDLRDNLKDTVKVDGETFEVTLSEQRSGHQKDRDYRQKTEALKRDREQWEEQRANYVEVVEQQHHIAAAVLNSEEQALAQAMNSEQMARLKETNREEWLTKRYEFQDRLQQIQQTRQQAAQGWNQFREQQLREQANSIVETLKSESAALKEKLPKLDRGVLLTYLTSQYGFSPEQINGVPKDLGGIQVPVGGVMDHRILEIAEKARLYDQQKSQAQETVNRVKKAPTAPKPGKGTSPAKIKRSELSKVKAKLKQSGKVQDAAEVFLKSGIV